MIELARHIEILLLENDCVIIPDFGGFIAHHQPARYIKEENLYLPPVRTIGFNPQLTLNDGLLVQSYMQAYHTDFPDATRMIEEEVKELKENLYKDGRTEIHGVGTLHYNMQSIYEFHPNEEGALSPNLYGFSSFSINKLEQLVSTVAPIKELLPNPVKRNKAIGFNRRWIGNVVAVAVILFFFLSVPVENTYIDKGNYASLGTDGLFETIRSQSLATTLVTVPAKPQQPQKNNSGKTKVKNNQNTLIPVAVKVEKVAKTEETSKKNIVVTGLNTEQPGKIVSKPATPKATVQKEILSTTKKSNYCIIVSSLAIADDAQQMLNKYKQKGYKDATVIEGNGRYRLSLYNFTDKATAYKKLNELKQNETFKNAWVLSSK